MAKTDCPKCGGTGWRTVAREAERGAAAPVLQAVRCECTATDRDARLLERARIPRRYEHCDFDNFDTRIYGGQPGGEAWDSSLEHALLVVQGFAREYPVGTDHGLLLIGPCGAGKTHLGVAAVKEIARRGHNAIFYDYRELLKQIQDSYNPERQATEMEVLEPVLTCGLLLLDDLGASKPSLWALETVGHILNMRYNEKRHTLITTNFLDREDAAPGGKPRAVPLPSGQAVRGAEDSLADRVGTRIRSRLYEMCRTVEIYSGDFRKEIRQAGRS